MGTKIRKAIPADADRLPEIEKSAGESFRQLEDLSWIADDDVMSAEEHLRHIKEGTVWVAEEGANRITGFLTAEQGDAELHIHEVSVHADHQGKRIGRRLIEAAYEEAQKKGLSALTLTTFRDVPWNAPFYARTGFEIAADHALGPRLQAILDRETDAGLPRDKRCAMRRRVFKDD